MAIAPPPSNSGASRTGSSRTANRAYADRATERELRQAIRVEVDRLLADRQLLAPGPQEEEQIRALIRDRVASYQREHAEMNQPLLSDANGVAERIFNDLLRLGLLEPLMRDDRIEEVTCNGPGRVFVVQDGRKRLVDDLFFDEDEDLRALVKRLIGPLASAWTSPRPWSTPPCPTARA